MYKASVLGLALFCVTTGSTFADDPDKEFREADKRYWEHQREMEKAELEAYKEHGKFHEEMDREEQLQAIDHYFNNVLPDGEARQISPAA